MYGGCYILAKYRAYTGCSAVTWEYMPSEVHKRAVTIESKQSDLTPQLSGCTPQKGLQRFLCTKDVQVAHGVRIHLHIQMYTLHCTIFAQPTQCTLVHNSHIASVAVELCTLPSCTHSKGICIRIHNPRVCIHDAMVYACTLIECIGVGYTLCIYTGNRTPYRVYRGHALTIYKAGSVQLCPLQKP